jgi:hypothetical protein
MARFSPCDINVKQLTGWFRKTVARLGVSLASRQSARQTSTVGFTGGEKFRYEALAVVKPAGGAGQDDIQLPVETATR